MTASPSGTAALARASIAIIPRDLRFESPAASLLQWRERDPEAAAFYNSLSALFPLGERFFIESVRAHRDCAQDLLAEEIKAFVKQEAIHTREHLAFNAQVRRAGYDPAGLEARTRKQVRDLGARPPLVRLGLTVALEHFTAALAHELLADPRHLALASGEAARLWRWHAVEEIEHKAVAFDTLNAATRGWSGLHRWTFRSRLFVEAVGKLIRIVWLNLRDLRLQDGPGAFTTLRALGFLLSRPGLFAAMLPALARFLRPGFHPWQDDDRALVQHGLSLI